MARHPARPGPGADVYQGGLPGTCPHISPVRAEHRLSRPHHECTNQCARRSPATRGQLQHQPRPAGAPGVCYVHAPGASILLDAARTVQPSHRHTARRAATHTMKHLHVLWPACLSWCVLQRLSPADLSHRRLEAAEVAVHTPKAGPAVPKPPEAATPDLTAAAGEGCLPRWMQQVPQVQVLCCCVHVYRSPAGCCSSPTALKLLLHVVC